MKSVASIRIQERVQKRLKNDDDDLITIRLYGDGESRFYIMMLR
jgi:hypothetical protein